MEEKKNGEMRQDLCHRSGGSSRYNITVHHMSYHHQSNIQIIHKIKLSDNCFNLFSICINTLRNTAS